MILDNNNPFYVNLSLSSICLCMLWITQYNIAIERTVYLLYIIIGWACNDKPEWFALSVLGIISWQSGIRMRDSIRLTDFNMTSRLGQLFRFERLEGENIAYATSIGVIVVKQLSFQYQSQAGYKAAIRDHKQPTIEGKHKNLGLLFIILLFI